MLEPLLEVLVVGFGESEAVKEKEEVIADCGSWCV